MGNKYLKGCPGVYSLTCIPTGDTYIGASKDVLLRYRQHISEMDTNKKTGLFKELVRKYGSSSFEYKLLRAEYNDSRLLLLEAEFIEKMKPSLNTSWGFGKLKYPVSMYKSILSYKTSNLDYKLKDVCKEFPDISPRVISDIINLRKYSWLKEAMPEEYERLLEYLMY